MYYGIRFIVSFIYGNEYHQCDGVGAFVPFERRKQAEGCVLLHGGMGHGHRMDDGEQLSHQLYQGAVDRLGVWRPCCDCAAGTDLRQKRKILFDSKGVGSGICCAGNGGFDYRIIQKTPQVFCGVFSLSVDAEMIWEYGEKIQKKKEDEEGK